MSFGGKEGKKGNKGEAPDGDRVGAAREWKKNQKSVVEGRGPSLSGAGPNPRLREEHPAFQELTQIPAEATTLLWCPNHIDFYLVAPPGVWQAREFLESALEGYEGEKQAGCGD